MIVFIVCVNPFIYVVEEGKFTGRVLQRELSMITHPGHVLRVDQKIDLRIEFDRGTEVHGFLNITSIDKKIVDLHALNFSRCSMCEECKCNISFPYMFPSPGMYRLTSYVYNLVSSTSKAKNITVLGQDLKSHTELQHHIVDNNITFVLVFLANVTLFPDTGYQVDFGDGDISTIKE